MQANNTSATLAEEQQRFIQTCDMFFLTPIDHRGFPACSYHLDEAVAESETSHECVIVFL